MNVNVHVLHVVVVVVVVVICCCYCTVVVYPKPVKNLSLPEDHDLLVVDLMENLD